MTTGPRIEMGRADIAELSRRFRRKVTEQRRAEPHRPAPAERETLAALVYPVGWNHNGEPVQWELQSIANHHAAGEVRVRGPSVELCKRRAAWVIAEGLRENAKMAGEQARERARNALITTTTLDRRPSVADQGDQTDNQGDGP